MSVKEKLFRRLCVAAKIARSDCSFDKLVRSHCRVLTRQVIIFLLVNLQGNYADAISCYNEVLRIDPMAADGLVNRGNTYKEIGRVNEAIQDYMRAITIRPNMAEAHANLASSYKDRFIV